MVWCDRCMATEAEDNRVLSELAHSQSRLIQDLLKYMQNRKTSLRDRASKFNKERLQAKREEQAEYEQRLKQYEEELSYQIMDRIAQEEDVDEIAENIARDETRKDLEQRVSDLRNRPEGLSDQDLEQSLMEYVERGDIDIERGEIKITPKGARKLASQVLRRILEKLANQELGPHALEEEGYGAERAPRSRKYEIGDEYDKLDFERTFLNALERRPESQGQLELQPEDFQVYEEVHQTKMIAGLMIDESGSMSGDKINAAIDTGLALSELIKREPKDLLKVYLFSEQVREVPYYEILGKRFSEGMTDISAALHAFRRGIASERGDKQAYLITDTEPNTQNGRYIGFDEAAAGVVQEALEFRKAGITLNIVMLDQNPKLKELASVLAKKNLGRVFFASPLQLGEMVIEDYLTHGKKAVSDRVMA